MKKYLVITNYGGETRSADLFVSKRDAYSLYAYKFLREMDGILSPVNNLEYYEDIFTNGSLTNIQARLEELVEEYMEEYKDKRRLGKTLNGYLFYGRYGVAPYGIEFLEIEER